MTKIKQAGPSVVVVALIAGAIGYILGCTIDEREERAEAQRALEAQAEKVSTLMSSRAQATQNAFSRSSNSDALPSNLLRPNTR